MRRAERDAGKRAGLTTDERQRLKELERENRELKRANEILRKASAFFAQAELDRRPEVNVLFVDANRENYGVEPICRMLPIGIVKLTLSERTYRVELTSFALIGRHRLPPARR